MVAERRDARERRPKADAGFMKGARDRWRIVTSAEVNGGPSPTRDPRLESTTPWSREVPGP